MPPGPMVLRLAWDEQYYTQDDFLLWYGRERGFEIWEEAGNIEGSDAQDVDNEITISLRFMVRRTTKNKACGSKPRATLYGRDIKTVLCILAGSHHILRGRLRMLGDPALSCRRLPSRGALRGNAHAKVRGKVKGKTPARAQALARAPKRWVLSLFFRSK